MARDFGTYRKLFDHPTPDFERLPFRVRCFAAEMIRRGDRMGRIVPLRGDARDGGDVTPSQFNSLVDDVAFHVRSTGPEDVEFIRIALPVLLSDTYFVFRGGWLTIRNFAESQRSDSADRMAAKRDRDSKLSTVTVTSVTSPGMVGMVSMSSSDPSSGSGDQPVRLGSESEQNPDLVPVVFEAWKRIHGHPASKLDQKRRARIKARLDEFSVEQLKQALNGAKNDPWLMGEDPKASRKYDGIETLLRDRAQVERLIELNEQPERLAQVSSADRIRQTIEQFERDGSDHVPY